MKKRIFASVIIALMLVAAWSTSAFAVSVSGPVTVQQGETVTLTIEGGSVEGVTADIETMGLEIVSFSGGLSDETSILLLEDYGGMRATYMYRVTAGPGQTASFRLVNVIESVNMVDTAAPGAEWQANVVSDTPSESPSASPSTEPSTAPSEDQQPSTAPSADQSPSQQPSEQPSAAASESAVPSSEQSQQPAASQSAPAQQSPAPQISGGTPSSGNGGQQQTPVPGGVVTVVPSNGGGTTTVVRLPKTADSTTNMWLFATLTAAVGTVAIIAAKKCAIGKKEAPDEQ